MKEFRCNGCLHRLHIGHESSVTTIDTRNRSYSTDCNHLFCDICRKRYCSICPLCRRKAQWNDTCRVMKDRFQDLNVIFRKLQKVHQFQLMHKQSVLRRLMDLKQEKKQRAWNRNKVVHVLKQQYQYLKNLYIHRLTLYKKIKQSEMEAKNASRPKPQVRRSRLPRPKFHNLQKEKYSIKPSDYRRHFQNIENGTYYS